MLHPSQKRYPEILPGYFDRPRNNVVIIVPIFEKSSDGRYYNAAVVIDADGTLHASYHKVHIPQDPGFFEKGYFCPGDRYHVHTTRYRAHSGAYLL